MIKGTRPVHAVIIDGVSPFHEEGICLREWIATHALQGILANRYTAEHGSYSCEDIAKRSVEQADALIAELNKPTTETP